MTSIYNIYKCLLICWLNTRVWSILLNRDKHGLLNRDKTAKITFFEMWVQIDRVNNENTLMMLKENRTLLNTIQKRMGNWMGHIMWGKETLITILETTVEGGEIGRKIVDYIMKEGYKTKGTGVDQQLLLGPVNWQIIMEW